MPKLKGEIGGKRLSQIQVRRGGVSVSATTIGKCGRDQGDWDSSEKAKKMLPESQRKKKGLLKGK